jgi:hypothetical protein
MEGRKVLFTGAVAFYENGTKYRDYPKNQPLFVGYPNVKVDEAWENLLYGSKVDLPTELAGRMKSVTWEEPQGGLYRTG